MDLQVTGTPAPLPAGVDQSAYRIVQEALTNVRRHAPGARATVAVAYGGEAVVVEVADDGPGDGSHRSAPGGGHGHANMRERAAMCGGTVRHLADDQALVRTGIRMIVDAQPDMQVVGEAGDGREAIDRTGELAPDVLLLDVRMPHLDGLEALPRLVKLPQPPKVIVLTTFDLDEYVFEALEHGASGFLLKGAPAEQLLAGIRAAAAGDALIDASITRRLIARFASRRPAGGPAAADLAALTDREREVLELLARGLTNAEIADRLFVSAATVKTHVAHVLAKLGLRDRVQAVILAYEAGLVTPGAGTAGG